MQKRNLRSGRGIAKKKKQIVVGPDSTSDLNSDAVIKKTLRSDRRIITALRKLKDSYELPQPSPQSSPSSSPITVNPKGVVDVSGRIIIVFAGEEKDEYLEPINCARLSVSALCFARDSVDALADMQSDALFILLVESFSMQSELLRTRFYDRFPCIVLFSSRPHPNEVTGLLLKKLHTQLRLPVFALLSCDPQGMASLLAYGSGSDNLYGSSAMNLITPNIVWLGVKPSDLNKCAIERQLMEDKDISLVNQMLEQEAVKRNPDWAAELLLMLDTKEKASINGFYKDLSNSYLTEVFLPAKLKKALGVK